MKTIRADGFQKPPHFIKSNFRKFIQKPYIVRLEFQVFHFCIFFINISILFKVLVTSLCVIRALRLKDFYDII